MNANGKMNAGMLLVVGLLVAILAGVVYFGTGGTFAVSGQNANVQNAQPVQCQSSTAVSAVLSVTNQATNVAVTDANRVSYSLSSSGAEIYKANTAALTAGTFSPGAAVKEYIVGTTNNTTWFGRVISYTLPCETNPDPIPVELAAVASSPTFTAWDVKNAGAQITSTAAFAVGSAEQTYFDVRLNANNKNQFFGVPYKNSSGAYEAPGVVIACDTNATIWKPCAVSTGSAVPNSDITLFGHARDLNNNQTAFFYSANQFVGGFGQGIDRVVIEAQSGVNPAPTVGNAADPKVWAYAPQLLLNTDTGKYAYYYRNPVSGATIITPASVEIYVS